jgi:seryl-tRNA synthetase
MIDLKKVRDDIQAYKDICTKRHMNIDVDAVLALDDQRKALQLEVDQTKAQQKQLAANKDYEGAKNLKTKIQELENKH